MRICSISRTTALVTHGYYSKIRSLTVILHNRSDVDLTAFYRVAWQREKVRIGADAQRQIAKSRACFLELIDKDPSVVIYGVTTAMGERASHRLTQDERNLHARIKPFPAATSFGDYLPDRVVRGIVFARLTNFIEGHAATTPRIAQAVAEMLDGAPMPAVPAAGQGGAGEILALYPLFAELSTRFELEVKERGSLINGSPCAAALLADAAIAARRRLQLALETFALSIEAFMPPAEFKRGVDRLIRDIRDSPRLPGVERIWLPGEQSHTKLLDRRAHGVPVPKALRESLDNVARDLNVELLG